MLHGRSRTFLAPWLPKRNSRDGGATGQLGMYGERLRRRPGGPPREPSKTIDLDGTVPGTPKDWQTETLCQGLDRRSFRSETSNLMRASAQTTATAWFLLLVPGMFQQLGLAKLAKLQSHMRLHWLGLVISDWDFKNLKAFSI